MNALTAFPARTREGCRSDDVMVVVEGTEVPAWVVEWCRRSGRELEVLRLPDEGGGVLHVPPHRLRVVAGLAGRTVLVARTVQHPGLPPRVVVGVRDLPDDAPVLGSAADAARHLGGDLLVVHGVPLSFGERSVGLDEALERGRRVLGAAVEHIEDAAPGLSVAPRLLRARPHEFVGETLDADLLVLGGPRTDRRGTLGLVACDALQHAPCPLLLVPRAG